jgi:mitogen-activated protein kinase kinase 3
VTVSSAGVLGRELTHAARAAGEMTFGAASASAAVPFHEAMPSGGRDSVDFAGLTVVKLLGSGASSTVRLAEERGTGRFVALKAVKIFEKSKRDQLLGELTTLFSCDCECLVGFYGATYREGEVLVALEYMDVGGLDRVLSKAGKIPERALAGICYQCCFGLGYLMVEKRIHRDIKGGNILLASDGAVKLTDFGLSRELQTSVLAKTFVGTFKYLSPERMASSAYDYKADTWSLGLVLLEGALGKYPYPESSATIGYVDIVLHGPVPLPAKGGGSGLSDAFIDCLTGMLQKDPTHRLLATEVFAHPWMAEQGVDDIDSAQAAVREWLEEIHLVKKKSA